MVKLVAAHDPVCPDLRCHIGEAGDEHHWNSSPLNFFRNRSAATRAGSSSRSKNDTVYTRVQKLLRYADAELLHLRRHGAGSGRNIIVVVKSAEIPGAF